MKRGLRALGRWLLADPYRLALLLLIVLYTALFTAQAWALHAGMRTHKADLGQIDQAIWNSSQGRFLQQTDNGFVATRLTDHVEPILVLISPIYWLWNDVRALLLVQVLAVALGALPLYALALRQLFKLLSPTARAQIWEREPVESLARPLAFVLALAYLLASPLQSALLTEFHAAPLAVPLILWAFWAVDARRWGQFVVAALSTALVKEEIALLAAGLGVWAIWRTLWEAYVAKRRPSTPPAQLSASWRSGLLAGAAVTVVALLWFYLATFVIVPANAAPIYGAGESTYFQRYGALGDSSLDIVESFFTQPQLVWRIATEPARLAYLANLLALFAWLPLFAPEVLLLALPVLLANLLSAYPAQYYGEFHYTAPLVPYFAVAAAYGLGRVWRWLARRTASSSASFQHLPAASTGAMTAMALVQNSRTALRPLMTGVLSVWILVWSIWGYAGYGRGPLGGRYDPTPITAHHRMLDRFVSQLPAGAAVTATAAVHPHVSHRAAVYQFPLGLDAPQPATWALLDVTTNTDMAPGDLKAQVDAMLAGDWGVVDAADGFLLLSRGVQSKAIPPEFYSFVRTPATPETSAQASSGPPLQLRALTADDWPRWRQTRMVVEWLVGKGYNPAANAPALEVTTPDQTTVATLGTTAPPGLVWYPPDRWQPGEVIRLTTLPLTLPRVTGVRASGGDAQTPAIFVRGDDGKLATWPPELAVASDLGAALNGLAGSLHSAAATLQLPSGQSGGVQAWLPARTYHPGEAIPIWLQWKLPAWPPGLSAFVHLRRNGANVAQQDGAPEWFGLPASSQDGTLNDWRQVTIPPDAPLDGAWSVVIGVYDPQNGARVPLVDAAGKPLGDELEIGALHLSPAPPPDQACALNAGAC